jgi:phosphoribosylformylglycinamidine synthase
VAVGADPSRIAILDNFCWGYTDRPETLGALVRAALACYDVAVALGTPFISGKDSLHNEFSYVAGGERRTIQIPHSLLISALGQVSDVGRCVTMDLKAAGNLIYQIGPTRNELGGSHLSLVTGLQGGHVPRVNAAEARRTFAAVHEAISQGLVRACHDPSEGGLAVALAEMAFAGGLGATIRLSESPRDASVESSADDLNAVLLFAESASRFVVEVEPANRSAFETVFRMAGVPLAHIGEVQSAGRLQIAAAAPTGRAPPAAWLIDLPLNAMKEAWQRPLRW